MGPGLVKRRGVTQSLAMARDGEAFAGNGEAAAEGGTWRGYGKDLGVADKKPARTWEGLAMV